MRASLARPTWRRENSAGPHAASLGTRAANPVSGSPRWPRFSRSGLPPLPGRSRFLAICFSSTMRPPRANLAWLSAPAVSTKLSGMAIHSACLASLRRAHQKREAAKGVGGRLTAVADRPSAVDRTCRGHPGDSSLPPNAGDASSGLRDRQRSPKIVLRPASDQRV
jgi:hypothetical protein